MRRPEWSATLAEKIALGRQAEPSEVANMALFLASALASYVTGATLPVDDGLTFYPLSAILDAG